MMQQSLEEQYGQDLPMSKADSMSAALQDAKNPEPKQPSAGTSMSAVLRDTSLLQEEEEEMETPQKYGLGHVHCALCHLLTCYYQSS